MNEIQTREPQKNPEPSTSVLLFNLFLAVISVIYLINPTAGVLELIPDNFPIVGNLDEAAAMMLLLRALYGTGKLDSLLNTLLDTGLIQEPRKKE